MSAHMSKREHRHTRGTNIVEVQARLHLWLIGNDGFAKKVDHEDWQVGIEACSPYVSCSKKRICTFWHRDSCR